MTAWCQMEFKHQACQKAQKAYWQVFLNLRNSRAKCQGWNTYNEGLEFWGLHWVTSHLENFSGTYSCLYWIWHDKPFNMNFMYIVKCNLTSPTIVTWGTKSFRNTVMVKTCTYVTTTCRKELWEGWILSF